MGLFSTLWCIQDLRINIPAPLIGFLACDIRQYVIVPLLEGIESLLNKLSFFLQAISINPIGIIHFAKNCIIIHIFLLINAPQHQLRKHSLQM